MRATVKTDKSQVDRFTGFAATVSSDHSYIHDGIGFTYSGTTGSVSAAGTYTVSFVTPAADVGYIHWRPTGLSSTANTLQMRLAEGSTVTGGTPATPRNRNRNSKKTSNVSVSYGVTLSAEGTILEYAQVGAGSNAANATGGGSDGSNLEWVLKPSTTYSLRFENVGSTTATVGYFNLFWYEEKKGNGN